MPAIFLAAYIAMSACRSSSLGLVAGAPSAMPMLARTGSSWPSASTGWRRASTIRSAARSAAAGSAPSSTTTNSSPPSRATVSPGADSRDQPLGDRDQQQVADLVPEGVVDHLEVVQVDQRHVDRAVAGRGQRGLQPLVEEHPVGQLGQRVVGGAVVEPLEQPAVLAEREHLPATPRPRSAARAATMITRWSAGR